MQIEEIGAKARAFQARIRRRRLLEHVAAVVTITLFARYAYVLPGWMIKTGSVLSILAMVNIVWQRHARAAARPVPEAPDAVLVDFHRSELVRFRDAVAGSWRWEILPVLPGFALIILGRLVQFHPPKVPIALDNTITILAAIIAALIITIVVLTRRLVTYRLQQQIDALDRLQGAGAAAS
jgi:hypothetical protein